MPEPRFLLIDTETGKQASISTDELQRVLWSIELGKMPGEGAYFEEPKRPRPSDYVVPQVCNSVMAAAHTERGVFFICGCCGEEILLTDRGVLEE